MKNIIFIAVIASLAGCGAMIPRDSLQMNESTLAARQLQTRFYATDDESILTSGAANILQDMGFSIDDLNNDLGLILASKSVDADNFGTNFLRVLVLLNKPLLDPTGSGIADKQKIQITFSVKPSVKGNGYLARVSALRVMLDETDRAVSWETLDSDDEDLYSEFFEKLSKSIFLEASKT